MKFDAAEIQEIIKYTFKDENLLRCAFTHRSYSHESKGYNNERLEFLGDSVLGFVVADYLFKKRGRLDEGRMTKEKQNLVSKYPLSKAIEGLGLQKYIIFGDSMDSGAPNVSSQENLFEALVAAIYLDGGIEHAKDFINEFLIKGNANCNNSLKQDSKSLLQIKTQAKKMGSPQYQLISKTGMDHEPLFTIAVVIDGKTLAVGQGRSKSDASKDAAKRALKKLTGRKN